MNTAPVLNSISEEHSRGAFKKYVTGLPPIFDPLPLVTFCHRLALNPLPPCHHQNSDKLLADNESTFDANFRSGLDSAVIGRAL